MSRAWNNVSRPWVTSAFLFLLVPKLYLGTHLPAKFHFAKASITHDTCEIQLRFQLRSQVQLGNEGGATFFGGGLLWLFCFEVNDGFAGLHDVQAVACDELDVGRIVFEKLFFAGTSGMKGSLTGQFALKFGDLLGLFPGFLNQGAEKQRANHANACNDDGNEPSVDRSESVAAWLRLHMVKTCVHVP